VNAARTLVVEPLSAAALHGCGVPLGLDPERQRAEPSYHSALSDFWHVHDFDPGQGGRPEILWVRYRNGTMAVTTLEAHLRTEQAVVPLDGAIVQVVCPTGTDGAPDLAALRALHVPAGTGVLMAPGCWHTTFVTSAETTCLMLTRDSTTRDLAAHLNDGAEVRETRMVALADHGAPVSVRPA
jgi:ureidoglycolate lyase